MDKQKVIELLIAEGSWLRRADPDICTLEGWSKSVCNSIDKIIHFDHPSADELKIARQGLVDSLAGAITEYRHRLWGGIEWYDRSDEDYKASVENFSSIKCAKSCVDAIFPHVGFTMERKEAIKILTGWLIAARESPDDSDESLRLSAEAAYNEITRHAKPSDDLTEIKSALGLPDDTPEPLVGLIWRLQQRVEALESTVRGPFPHPELQDLDKPEVPQICGETLGGFICDEIKGHKRHHVGIRKTDNRISWPNVTG